MNYLWRNTVDKMRKQNYEQARDKMKKYIGESLSHDIIRELNGLVMGLNQPSEYRKGSGVPPIKNQLTGKTRYLPPDAVAHPLKELTEELINWYAEELSLIEKVARLHWGLVKIHPFDDGNGRTARILTLFVLLRNGYDDIACQRLEEYFENNRRAYEDALDDGEIMYTNFRNVSPEWCAYIKEGLAGVARAG